MDNLPLELWSRIMDYLIGGVMIARTNEIWAFIERMILLNELKNDDRFRARRDVMTITAAVIKYCNRYPLWMMKSELIRCGNKNIILHHKQRRYHYSYPYMITMDDVYMFFYNGTTYVSVHTKFT